MNNTISHTLAAAALLFLGACSKPDNGPEKGPEQEPPVVEKNHTAHFSATADAAMDLNLMYTINNGILTETGKMTLSEDGKTATLDITVPKTFIAPYDFCFATPLSSITKYNRDNSAWVVEIPSTQEPTTTEVDGKARIFAAWVDSMDEIPEETIALDFHPVTAFGKVAISNLPQSAGAVSKISLAFVPGVAGRFQYSKGTLVEKLISNVITLTTASTSGVLFGCAPAKLAGTDIVVTVSAEGGDYTKTFPAPADLEAGKTNEFTFDFTGVHSSLDKIYTMVTSASELKSNDEVIIVCTANAKAVSTVQNAKNRGAADITFEDDGSVKNPAANVQTLTITVENGKIAFHTGTTYMGPLVSTDNCNLQEIESLQDAWLTLSIDESGDTAMCYGEYTLKYYGKNNVFNMFLPSTGKPVQIYKRN